MKKEPLVSVIIPTYNSEKELKKFFYYFNKQNFDFKRIEILVIDGGSKDNTKLVAKKNRAKVIKNPLVLAEPAVNIGFQKAKGELMIVLATDNYLVDKNFLNKMLKPFSDKNIFAAFPKHNSFKFDNFLTKYINTFSDPFTHFIYGYATNARTFYKKYKIIYKNKDYVLYDYKSNNIMPMIACAQGFMVRKIFFRDDIDSYDDISPIYKLINNNKQIAYVYSASVVHQTIENTKQFMRKQIWATQNFLNKKKYGVSHRKIFFTKFQLLKIRIWPFYSISFIFPFLRGLYGFFAEKKVIWLFHPIISFLSIFSSLIAFFNVVFLRKSNIARKD